MNGTAEIRRKSNCTGKARLQKTRFREKYIWCSMMRENAVRSDGSRHNCAGAQSTALKMALLKRECGALRVNSGTELEVSAVAH